MPSDLQISKLAAYLNVSVEHLKTGAEIDPDHMMLCQILFALSTGAETRYVEAAITFMRGVSATKV